MPTLDIMRGLKIERRAFQPFGRVQLAGFRPGRVALLAFANFFHQVLSVRNYV